MKRTELSRQFFPLSEREAFRKAGYVEKKSPFYNYLEEMGYMDAYGIYRFPMGGIKRNFHALTNYFWDNLRLSEHQDKLRVSKTARYSNEPLHCHDYMGIYYVYNGEAKILTRNGSFIIHKNDVCLMNDGFIHASRLEHDEDIVIALQIDKEYLSSVILKDLARGGIVTGFIMNYILKRQTADDYLIFQPQDAVRIKNAMEDLLCEYLEPRLCGKTLIECYMKVIFIELINSHCDFSNHVLEKQYTRIGDILYYITQHPADCTLESIASHFGYTLKYLSRLIKQCTGKTYTDLVAEERMKNICSMLRNTTLPIKEIAEHNGYSCQTHFYQKFRQIVGMTPNEYRKNTI